MPGRLLKAMIGQIDRSALFLRRLAHAVRSDGAAFFTISPIRNARRIAAMCKARSFEAEGEFERSASEWNAILQSHPDARISYLGYGRILRKLNRPAESRAVLSRAIERFPRDFDVMLGLAVTIRRAAPLAAPLPEAIAQARDIVARHPREPRGHVLLGRIYRDAGLVDQADETLLAGRRTCPGDLGLAWEYALAADGRWLTALSRWQELRQDFPAAGIGYAGLGAVLKRLKRFDEADDVLVRGMARFPKDDNIGVNHAWVAEDREDWPEALRRWEALWQRFPRNRRIETGLVECRGKARAAAAFRALDGGHDAEAGLPIAPFQTTKTGPSLEHADLFMRFESVGENCEFGFVQRYFGAEPLGLFRWGGLPFDRLLQGLSNGFQDLGRAETTELHVNADNDEYYTRDRASGLMTHGFLSRGGISEEVAFSRLCRRLGYLRDKFLEDLAAREKIFVFTSLEPLEDRAFRQLNDAMARHGAVHLLCMRMADETHPPGTVYLLAGGPMVGHLDRLGFDGKNWNISFDVWRLVCQRAAATVEVGGRPQG